MSRHRWLLRIIMCLALVTVAISSHAQNKYLKQLLGDAVKATKNGQWKEADNLYEKYVTFYRNEGYIKGFDYTEALNYLVRRAISQGRIDQALELQKEIIEVRRTASDCTDLQLASSMSDLASVYAQKAQYQKAVETGEEAVQMMKKCYGPKHQFTCIALSNLANFYSARGESGDNARAVELCEMAVKHMKRGTQEYAKALNSLVIFYTKNGDLTTANAISKKARKQAKKRLEEDGIGYATVLINQAIRLANADNYDEAMAYAVSAYEIFHVTNSTNTLSYAKLLVNMATFHSHQHRYQEAETILNEALPILEQIVGKQHPDYVRCVSELSVVYKNQGNMEKADETAHLSDQLGQSLDDRDNFKYAQSLSKQAAIFASNGNYQRAMEHERRAIAIYKNRGDSLEMAFGISVLANYLFADNQKEKGLQTAQEALEVFRHRNEPSARYGQVLNNTSILYFNYGRYEEADSYGRQALEMYQQMGDTVNAVYARILANNALFAYTDNRIDEALHQGLQSIDLHTRLLGEQHPDNVPLLYNLAVYQSQTGQSESAEATCLKALKLQAEQVRTNFLYLTSYEREAFWNRKNYVFKFVPLLAYRDKDEGRMNAEAYNALLFTKGILLNSDIDFKSILLRSGDQTLLEQYGQLEQLHKEEEGLYRQPASEQTAERARLIKENIYQLERALVKGCKEYGQFTEMLNIRTEQVAKALAPDEAAIEFTDFYAKGVGTVYVAFVLRHGQTQPTLVRMFDDVDLRKLTYQGGKSGFYQALKSAEGINEIYNDRRLGAMVWKSIVSQLGDVKSIYFSPTSLFYQLGIEYLYANETERIDQMFNVYRVSSTKSLVNREQAGHMRRAAVYGGLDYDMDLAQLQEHHQHIVTGTEYLTAMANPISFSEMDIELKSDLRALDSLSVRGSVGYLEGTLHEAEDIVEQLMQNNVQTRVYTGEDGTEETFKSLSGQDLDIIHVATHGFYFSAEELKQTGLQLAFADLQEQDCENALNYSGLLLSGANYVLRGNKLPDDIENGVLTAREIAKLDLGHVGLVVLSACQTGLGEIKEDGVFGIQRGFKKAGAQSLLMSLWKVNDQATDLMMTQFYTYLVAGYSRHKAFEMAQQAVREGGFPEPYYWASFILLDGQN